MCTSGVISDVLIAMSQTALVRHECRAKQVAPLSVIDSSLLNVDNLETLAPLLNGQPVFLSIAMIIDCNLAPRTSQTPLFRLPSQACLHVAVNRISSRQRPTARGKRRGTQKRCSWSKRSKLSLISLRVQGKDKSSRGNEEIGKS